MFDDGIVRELRETVRKDAPGTLKYVRLQDALLVCIADNRLKPGFKLPTDKDLSQTLEVSLGTVQKALGNLEKQGVLSRAPRRGTIIEENKVSEDDIFVFRFRDQETDKLIAPRVRGLSIGEEVREGPWRQHLNCKRIMRFERLLQVALEPPVYSEVFVPYELAEDWNASQHDVKHGYSVHRYLQQIHGLLTTHTMNSVHVGVFDAQVQKHLMTQADVSGLIWDVCGYSQGDRSTTFQRLHVPPDHRPIEFRRSLSE